jgi:hypothetical protein
VVYVEEECAVLANAFKMRDGLCPRSIGTAPIREGWEDTLEVYQASAVREIEIEKSE